MHKQLTMTHLEINNLTQSIVTMNFLLNGTQKLDSHLIFAVILWKKILFSPKYPKTHNQNNLFSNAYFFVRGFKLIFISIFV